ncbi:MAG: esterase family protein [Desulfopila sp.]
MQVKNHQWYSPALSKDMPLRVYGHWGAPLLVFPCSQGRYFDYEGMGMIDAIAAFIDAGVVKVYCVDSVDAESWYNFSASPAERNHRYQQYDSYIVNEVLPFIRTDCQQGDIGVMTNGCSMGAYHAVNMFLKHPDLFAGCIALSGLYRLDCKEFALQQADIAEVYFNSPLHYLAGLDDSWFLERCRQGRIVVCVGQGAWEDEALADTRGLDHLFSQKNIAAWVDYWGHDVNHDWPWWYRQMTYFLEKLYRRP